MSKNMPEEYQFFGATVDGVYLIFRPEQRDENSTF